MFSFSVMPIKFGVDADALPCICCHGVQSCARAHPAVLARRATVATRFVLSHRHHSCQRQCSCAQPAALAAPFATHQTPTAWSFGFVVVQGGWVDDTLQTTGANCPEVGRSCGKTGTFGASKGKWSSTCCQECAKCEQQTTGFSSGEGKCVAVTGCTKSTTAAPTTAAPTPPPTTTAAPTTTIPVEQLCVKADAFTSGGTGSAPSASNFKAAADSPAGSPATRASPQAAALAVSMAAAVQLAAGLF